jgi:AsmA family protein
VDHPRRRRARRLLIALALLVGVPMAIGLAFDSNWLKGPLERAVSARVGRPFHIHGRLDIVPRWEPRLLMEQVQLANPKWAIEPDTLRIERAEISLALLPLLRGEVVLPQVTLSKPLVALERSVEGANNWTLAPDDEPERQRQGRAPTIGRLTVDEGLLLYHDPAQDTALSLEVQTTEPTPGERGVRFRAGGVFHGQRVAADGTGGAMLSLADTTAPYPLDGRFRVGATAGTVSGSITGLARFTAADLVLDLRGETLSELYRVIGVAFPPTPPYQVRGRLLRATGWWRFREFAGRVGDSDLSGDLDIAYRDQRRRIAGRLQSERLDLDDLGGFVGASPGTGPGETASARQERAAAAAAAKPRLLPDLPIRLERLRATDADVRFTGKSIRGRTPVENLDTHLVLRDGIMTLQPLNFGVAGGDVVGTLALDGRAQVAGVDGDFEFRRIDLRKLFPGNPTIARSAGLVGGRADLKGNGNSLAEVLGDADGSLGLAMAGGQVSNLVLELAGLDAGEALRLLFRGDKPVGLRCAVADVGVRDGIIETRSVIVDTTDTNLTIEGTVNLASEELDLTLRPLPKDYSLLALRTPLHLRGTFKDPAVRLDDKLAVRGGIAAILGAVAGPVAALAALVESGPGDDANCAELIAAVQRPPTTGSPGTGSP